MYGDCFILYLDYPLMHVLLLFNVYLDYSFVSERLAIQILLRRLSMATLLYHANNILIQNN